MAADRAQPARAPERVRAARDSEWNLAGMSALRYRAVVFDLDGTLVDSYAALAESVNFARRGQGLPELAERRIRDFVGEGLDRLLQRAFDCQSIPEGVREAFESRYDEI